MKKIAAGLFAEELQGFFSWSAQRSRTRSQWWAEMEEYAAHRYAQEYERENPKEEK